MVVSHGLHQVFQIVVELAGVVDVAESAVRPVAADLGHVDRKAGPCDGSRKGMHPRALSRGAVDEHHDSLAGVGIGPIGKRGSVSPREATEQWQIAVVDLPHRFAERGHLRRRRARVERDGESECGGGQRRYAGRRENDPNEPGRRT
jgi:hypothetical protein